MIHELFTLSKHINIIPSGIRGGSVFLRRTTTTKSESGNHRKYPVQLYHGSQEEPGEGYHITLVSPGGSGKDLLTWVWKGHDGVGPGGGGRPVW